MELHEFSMETPVFFSPEKPMFFSMDSYDDLGVTVQSLEVPYLNIPAKAYTCYYLL